MQSVVDTYVDQSARRTNETPINAGQNIPLNISFLTNFSKAIPVACPLRARVVTRTLMVRTHLPLLVLLLARLLPFRGKSLKGINW